MDAASALDVPAPSKTTSEVRPSEEAPRTETRSETVETVVELPQVNASSFERLGTPSADIRDSLKFKEWAADGGAIKNLPAPQGLRYLIVNFPDTALQRTEVQYKSSSSTLQTDGGSLQPTGATPGGGYEVLGRGIFQQQLGRSPDGRLRSSSPFLPLLLISFSSTERREWRSTPCDDQSGLVAPRIRIVRESCANTTIPRFDLIHDESTLREPDAVA